jgi:hypothetical protein
LFVYVDISILIALILNALLLKLYMLYVFTDVKERITCGWGELAEELCE